MLVHVIGTSDYSPTLIKNFIPQAYHTNTWYLSVALYPFQAHVFFSKSTSGRKYIIHHPSWCNSYITCLITLLNHFHIALGNHPQPLIILLNFMGLIFLKKWSISFQVYYFDILSIFLFQILRILAKKITVTRH